jgi:DNA/RNA endonuclease YhcR with UshA esterase domain
MRALFSALFVSLVAAPAIAETIAPCDAAAHVSQVATVEGPVNEVHHAASGRAIFLDMGGRYPNNCFAAVIFSDDESKFPNVDALAGKVADVTGPIRLYRGKPEIILNDPAQIKAK